MGFITIKPPFGIARFTFFQASCANPSIKQNLNQLEFQVWVSEGFWMFFFLHSLSMKQICGTFCPVPTFDVKAIMLAVTNSATGRFPPTILISKVAFGHLDYLGREWGVRLHVKALTHLRIIYMCHMSIWKQDVFWKKKKENAQNISPQSCVNYNSWLTCMTPWL